MIRRLPPVRAAAPLARVEAASARAQFEQHLASSAQVYGSGTQALAEAIRRVAMARGTSNPEVIIPAYSCPDLISACLFAKTHPRLVDLKPDGTWGYDPAGLDAAAGPNTVAVVAMNLLGTGDGAELLAPWCRNRGLALIQDSAQHFPMNPVGLWAGDYIVLSFGRGKPVNLMRGGALLVPSAKGMATARDAAARDTDLYHNPLAAVFNLATHPMLYGITSRMPGLSLGATTFKPLQGIDALQGACWRRIGAGVRLYLRGSAAVGLWRQLVPELSASHIALVWTPPGNSSDRLLRLPLLAADGPQRDRLVTELERRGLGASKMYGFALNRIAGVPVEVSGQGPFPNAEAFAARLFTLPTHAKVTARDVEITDACLRRFA